MPKFFNSNPKYLSKTSSMAEILVKNFINAIEKVFDKYFGLELKNFGMNSTSQPRESLRL